MKKLFSCLSIVVILFLLSSGIFADFVKFFLWLFTLQYSQPETTIAGAIIVRILTFIVSYSLVGLIFGILQLFDSKIMSVFYFVISTLLGFIISYIVWIVEKYLIVIIIILSVIILLTLFLMIIFILKDKKIEENKENYK